MDNKPARRSSVGKAPVMVWIPGGSNVEGASQGPYETIGPALARKGVVVSINYRRVSIECVARSG
jgi:carboxylesterase type B